MGLNDLLNSHRAGMFALALSRLLPPAAGFRLADIIARWLASKQDLAMLHAIRLNQWVVSGKSLSAEELDRATEEVLRHITSSFFTLFHYYGRPQAMQSLVNFSPAIEELIAISQGGKQGAVAVGVHMSNFDLIMQAAVQHGLKALAISLPQTTEAIEWQHQMRRMSGVELVPATVASLRQAIRHLQEGGVVITGMDHPVPGTNRCPRFFGHPANIPVHYIHMAVAAKVPLLVVGAIYQPDGLYHIITSEYLHMQPCTDHRDEILVNAEMALEVAADLIRQAPRQWTISQPVWPDLAESVPGRPGAPASKS